MSVCTPETITKTIHSQYPTMNLVWNNQKHVFEFVETYVKGAANTTRVIGEYRNPDGSPTPVVSDRVMDFLHRADTRKWPVMDRVTLWRKQRAEAQEAKINKAVDEAGARVLEDYSRIAGIPTFFFGPSMKEARETQNPNIQKLLKARGLA